MAMYVVVSPTGQGVSNTFLPCGFVNLQSPSTTSPSGSSNWTASPHELSSMGSPQGHDGETIARVQFRRDSDQLARTGLSHNSLPIRHPLRESFMWSSRPVPSEVDSPRSASNSWSAGLRSRPRTPASTYSAPSSNAWKSPHCAIVHVHNLCGERLGEFCSDAKFQAILGEKGLADSFIELEMRVAKGAADLLVRVASQEAADCCVQYFEGRSWGPAGGYTEACCVRSIDQQEMGSSKTVACQNINNSKDGTRRRAKATSGELDTRWPSKGSEQLRAPWSPAAELEFAYENGPFRKGRKPSKPTLLENKAATRKGGNLSQSKKPSKPVSVVDYTLDEKVDACHSSNRTFMLPRAAEPSDAYDPSVVTDDGF